MTKTTRDLANDKKRALNHKIEAEKAFWKHPPTRPDRFTLTRDRWGNIQKPRTPNEASALQGIAWQRIVRGWHADQITLAEAHRLRPDLTRRKVMALKYPPHKRKPFTPDEYRRAKDGTLI